MASSNSEPLQTSQEDGKHPHGTCGALVCRTWNSGVQDFIAYLNEYVYYCGYSLDTWMDSDSAILMAQQSISTTATSADVVVFAKPGCGYCKRAKALLQEQHSSASNPAFTEVVVDVVKSSAEGAVLAKALVISLQLGDMTFPQILIRGRYIGGADDLSDLVAAGQLPRLLGEEVAKASPKHIVPWEAQATARAGKADLFTVPHMRGADGAWYPQWPWYGFQWCLYSNLVRYISIVQLGLMIPAYFLYKRGAAADVAAAQVLMWILLYDLCAIIIFGPSPWSISGLISTYFGWRVRGNATSALPYKVVFLAYVITFVPLFFKQNYSSLMTSLLAYISNSTILVVFRF